ncbi:MAG: uroporphyrinogen-III synthase [Candidatus Acidiferrales bacterium]
MSATNKPLAGKRIVMTRAREQSPKLFGALSEAGAFVTLLPCIDFVGPDDWGPLDSAISHLDMFDWLAFTSQNAVRFFRERQRKLDSMRSVPPPGHPKVAALGVATAEVAAKEGCPPDFVASGARSGPEFVAAFAPLARGQKILLPQSDRAGDRISAVLGEAGAIVTSVVAYRTCVPQSIDNDALARIQRDGADLIFFGSPSAFRNFAETVGKAAMMQLAKHSAFGAVGPTTSGAIRDAGAPVAFESPQPGVTAVVKAMEEYFAEGDRAKIRP